MSHQSNRTRSYAIDFSSQILPVMKGDRSTNLPVNDSPIHGEHDVEIAAQYVNLFVSYNHFSKRL